MKSRSDLKNAEVGLAWLGVHLILLNGAEQRISTFVDWGWTVLTKEHGKRMILSDAPIGSKS
jgi:hypothetical protein